MNSYRSLIDKFEKTKQELGEAESSLRRITGRYSNELKNGAPGSSRYKPNSTAAALNRASRSNQTKPPFTTRKRSREGESSHENESSSSSNDDEDDEESPNKKPALQSTIVAQGLQKKSRKATIEEQNVNSNIKARNRRMFGALIGTLKKFQNEEKTRQPKESKRAEILKKVEAATKEESERLKQEKENLLVTRREKQIELRCLEKKIERAESYEIYEANQQHLLNFLMTKFEPRIFFLPSSHTSETKKYLEESRTRIKEQMERQKEIVEADLLEIEEWYKKDSPLSKDKENNEDKEENEAQDVAQTDSEFLAADEESKDHDSNFNSNCNPIDDIESDSAKNVGSFSDQDFEPIYD